jgi:metal-dependent amidase/aminoacylase/carboxypeptidase family protein
LLQVDLKYTRGYPPTINAYPEAVEALYAAAGAVVGTERGRLPMKTAGAEDFGMMLAVRYHVAPADKHNGTVKWACMSDAPCHQCNRPLRPTRTPCRPGAFFFVGGALPGELRPHHKSVFDVDEDCMLVGASVFVQLVHDLLGTKAAAAPGEAPPNWA